MIPVILDQPLFATAPRGMEPLLTAELSAMGAESVITGRAGVAFEGGMETAYRACLWSRFASRVLLSLSRFQAGTPEELYAGVRDIDWTQHVSPDGTLAVDCHSAESHIDHTHFAALKVKDAIVDQIREACGVRPSVELRRPDLRVNLYIYRNEARIAVDLAGEGLHRRGYRRDGGEAPLKENLAAAILARAGWPEIAAAGGSLVDLMCGSGTLCIEAAMMAADIAPGLRRSYFGFSGWKGYDAQLWTTLVDDAKERCEAGLATLPPISGFDIDADAVRIARANVGRAGLGGKVRIDRGDAAAATPSRKAGGLAGLVVANPPYGERLGEQRDIEPLYARLGGTLKTHFGDWRAAVFTGNPKLAGALRLRPHRSYSLYNGPIKCRLLCFSIASTDSPQPRTDDAKAVDEGRQESSPAPAGSEMLANRLRKNLRTTGRWTRREGITCYRLYDADLPEYAFAVDVYQGAERWVHVQEYEPPASVDPAAATRRRQEGLETVTALLEVPAPQVFFKMRRQQKGKAQYEKQGASARFFEVAEGDCQFRVNFSDYLDTGLFLDQRLTRDLIRQRIGGGRFLNLFAYTGAATVCAAVGGAESTTSVDMSKTYLDWTRRNLELNGYSGANHGLVRADCVEWLDEQGRGKKRGFDLIWLDPPTFSNSKRMDREFDVQRDHVEMIGKTARLLTAGGVLLFSTNYRRFKLDEGGLSGLQVKDISSATLPRDFARRKRMHNCWEITST